MRELIHKMAKNLELLARKVKKILDNSNALVVEVNNLSYKEVEKFKKDYLKEYSILGITSLSYSDLNKKEKYTLHMTSGGSKNV